MPNYLATEDIYVFPSARRMNKQVSARLISEASLANIVNKLIETDGFVITPEPEPIEGDADSQKYALMGFIPSNPFEFNVYGYYFNAVTAQKILNLFSGQSVDTIYANIYLDSTSVPNYVELKSSDSQINELDDGIYFKGLTFSDSDLTVQGSEPQANYSLLLFSKESITVDGTTTTEWVVPIESRLKFIYTIALGVDGGEIFEGDISV